MTGWSFGILPLGGSRAGIYIACWGEWRSKYLVTRKTERIFSDICQYCHFSRFPGTLEGALWSPLVAEWGHATILAKEL